MFQTERICRRVFESAGPVPLAERHGFSVQVAE